MQKPCLASLRLAIWMCAPGVLVAAQLPAPSKGDARIGYINYSKGNVAELQVQRGTVTRIVLAEDEKILQNGLASGFLADCASATSEWCIRGDAGTNQIFIKPKEKATHNNLELRTNRRDYSVALRVLPDGAGGGKRGSAMYRVEFRYPTAGSDTTDRDAPGETAGEQGVLKERMARARSTPRNWAYTMQVLPGAHDFAPSLVFDDGRFTYFRFMANREIPTVYSVAADGEESRVNFHIDEHDDNLLVVEKMSRQFVLRLGATAVGIWNEKFDPDGVAPSQGTTVRGVRREIRKGGPHGD